jgi:hypothetical protein
MPASVEVLYRAHVQNIRSVDTALTRISRELNASLARSDDTTADALLKTSMLLMGAWAENKLRKFSCEPNGFDNSQREHISAARSQLESWKAALEQGFRKRYEIPRANLTTALPLTPRAYFQELTNILDNELRPIIEVRNKLAHGQWAQTPNSANTNLAPTVSHQIAAENAHTIKCKKRLLEYMAQMIHDLVAGNHAFERDIDKHYRNLENAKRDISHRSYEAWLEKMRQKFRRRQAARNR